jgi:hypothetical protein
MEFLDRESILRYSTMIQALPRWRTGEGECSRREDMYRGSPIEKNSRGQYTAAIA